jgi:thiol:disulfide interchange protein DsbC
VVALSEYNKRGITVKYIPWPRGGEYLNNGMPNPTFNTFHKALCSSNKKKAIDDIFYQRPLSKSKKCSADKLRNYIKVGKDLGITATHVVIDRNGTLIPGYRQPDELLYILDSSNPKRR